MPVLALLVLHILRSCVLPFSSSLAARGLFGHQPAPPSLSLEFSERHLATRAAHFLPANTSPADRTLFLLDAKEMRVPGLGIFGSLCRQHPALLDRLLFAIRRPYLLKLRGTLVDLTRGLSTPLFMIPAGKYTIQIGTCSFENLTSPLTLCRPSRLFPCSVPLSRRTLPPLGPRAFLFVMHTAFVREFCPASGSPSRPCLFYSAPCSALDA